MTMYERYKKLKIDFSQLSLEPGDTRSDYFCTPKGAEVIGWARVDGIHCCFIKGFGEMVFAVSPANGPGEYVHPLARNFTDFLRLVLACGGVDAIEQAWMWNRGELDAFLETYLPSPKQRAALDGLRDGLGLTLMEDPYGYIQEVQYGFDYSRIPYSEEYYELVPQEPEAPPERPEWKVYFDNGFSSRHRDHDKPRKEISVNRTFPWGGKTWHIPAAYVCGKGLVVDLCMEVDPAELRSFLEKWWSHGEEEDREFTPEEQERQEAEDPMNLDFTPRLAVNGREPGGWSGNGARWIPDFCRPESERGQSRQEWETVWLMEHYGLDPERGWMFWRYSFPWATKTKPALKTVSLTLKQNPVSVPGPRFTVSGAGDTVPFTNPVTGEAHTLQVVEYEEREVDTSRLGGGWEYPTHCMAMSYAVEPSLSGLTIQDCGRGDSPQPLKEQDAITAVGGMDGPTAACSVGLIGVIGGTDGPTTIALAGGKSGQLRGDCSSLYFAPPERIEWKMTFHQKTVEDIEVEIVSE